MVPETVNLPLHHAGGGVPDLIECLSALAGSGARVRCVSAIVARSAESESLDVLSLS